MNNREKAKTRCHCINLRRAANSITKMYDAAFSEIGLSGNQFYLLVSISEMERCSVTELSNYVGLDRTTLVRTLKPLIASGLIIDNSEHGKRNRVLQITDYGHEQLERGTVIWNGLQLNVDEEIGAEKMLELEQILEKIDCMI